MRSIILLLGLFSSAASQGTCGCEVESASFCNYDYGDGGFCESCPGDDADECDRMGLPIAGAHDCHLWCFGNDVTGDDVTATVSATNATTNCYTAGAAFTYDLPKENFCGDCLSASTPYSGLVSLFNNYGMEAYDCCFWEPEWTFGEYFGPDGHFNEARDHGLSDSLYNLCGLPPPSLTAEFLPKGTPQKAAIKLHPAAAAIGGVALVASIAIAAVGVRRSQRIPVTTAPQLV